MQVKKVLIISYYFPPRLASGSVRTMGLAKHLPMFGWEPIVLTANLPGPAPTGIQVIETEYKDILASMKSRFRFDSKKSLHEQMGISVTKDFNYSTVKSKIIKLLKESIAFPDGAIGWQKFAIEKGSEFLSKEKVDAIISTSPPPTAHLIANRLKQKYRIPWIADFRDPWTTKYPWTKSYHKFSMIGYLEKRLEIKTISDADALVSVTEPYTAIIKTLHKDKPIFCIPNGYDPDDFNEVPPKLTDKFTITYTGTLYNGRRDPSLLFEVLAQLIEENKINKDLVEIRLYSPKEEWLINEIKKYKLNGIVKLCGFVSREEALRRQRESQLLLLMRLDSKNERGDCPAKIYEYFGARRPIVSIGGCGGIVQDLLENTNTGKFAENAETLRNILLEYYKEFIESGEIKCQSNSNIENYTYESIAKKYSEILNKLVIHSIDTIPQ